MEDAQDFYPVVHDAVREEIGETGDVKLVNAVDALRRPAEVRIFYEREGAAHDLVDQLVGERWGRDSLVVVGDRGDVAAREGELDELHTDFLRR